MEKHHAKFGAVQEDNILLSDSDTLQASLIESIAELPFSFNENDLLNSAKAIAQNHQAYTKRQLLVDISELIQRDFGTGIQRVTRSVLLELLKNPPDGWRVEPVFANEHRGYLYARQFTQRLLGLDKREPVDDPVEYLSGDIFLGLDLLHPRIASFNRDFYQSLRNHGVKVFFVVYDLLPILLPQYIDDGMVAGFHKWVEIIAHSDGAICISKTVADELGVCVRKHGPERLRPFKISWFHLGTDTDSSIPSLGMPDDADTVLQALRKHISFLMVGTIEPRKDHAQVFAAFEQLWADGIDANLVIVGKQGWKVEELIDRLRQHSELGKRLFWLEGISDEYLEKVYAASTCLIAASEGEGFGLPLIEAAKHKLPIIARDIPVFREVAGEHAYYFKGSDSAVLVTVIQDWLTLNAEGKVPQSKAMPWLTWKESTEQLLQAIIH